MSVASLPRDWLASPLLQLLFQNLVVEEREDIRNATLSTWQLCIRILSERQGWLEEIANQNQLFDWYAIVMTPLGVAVNTAAFYNASLSHDGGAAPAERHNVDKHMLAQDLLLVPVETTLRARVAAAQALAYVMTRWPSQVSFFVNLMHIILKPTPFLPVLLPRRSFPPSARPLY